MPFMNRTTGADATALSIAALISEDRSRAWMGNSRNAAGPDFERRFDGADCRKTCVFW